MLEHILKKSNDEVVMNVSPNGVIYLRDKEDFKLMN